MKVTAEISISLSMQLEIPPDIFNQSKEVIIDYIATYYQKELISEILDTEWDCEFEEAE